MPEDGFCDVEIAIDISDYSEFWREVERRARKEYVCQECKATINKGDKYEVITSIYAGDIETLRVCIPCRDISKEFMTNGRQIGVVWEDFEQQWQNGAHIQACMNRVNTVAAKQKLLDRWKAWKGIA